MPYRKDVLISGEIFHLYNRGVEKRLIFSDNGDYIRFLDTLKFYSSKNQPGKFSTFIIPPPGWKRQGGDVEELLVEIYAYCLMPNHFHLLLKQLVDNGISILLGKLLNSYTKYFNTKYQRTGHLFQGTFKSVRVRNDEQFLHLSRYIHLNPYSSKIVADPFKYRWSSLAEYINKISGKSRITNTQAILTHFESKNNYKKFIIDYADYARALEIIKSAMID